jgi:hypothetical protein
MIARPRSSEAGGAHSAKVWPEEAVKENAEGKRAGGNSEAVRGRENSEAVLETVKDQDEGHEWTTCSSNAYGAFIHVALQAGLWKAMTLTLPMVMVSTIVQAGKWHRFLLFS